MLVTKQIFGCYEKGITEEVEEEIEQHLKEFFTLLLEWGKGEEETENE